MIQGGLGHVHASWFQPCKPRPLVVAPVQRVLSQVQYEQVYQRHPGGHGRVLQPLQFPDKQGNLFRHSEWDSQYNI